MPTSHKAFRWIRRLLLALLGLIVLALAAGLWLLAGSRARLDGDVHPAAGPAATVHISRDALGIATIEAGDRLDVSYALGYVHAQERYFAMDLMRRQAAGELAELVGPAALEIDIAHRRHRLRAVAEAAYAQLPAEQKQLLDRYRDGVNAGLAGLHVRPWEYLLLGSQPQPWRAQDSFLVIAAMYLELNEDGRNARELRIAQMRSVLPGPLVDFLLAPDPDWEAPLSGNLSHPEVLPALDALPAFFHGRENQKAAIHDRTTGTPALFHEREDQKAAIHGRTPQEDHRSDAALLASVLAPEHDDYYPGSNNFAVAGSLTESGSAILANDMHLGLRVPNLWFRARLRYADPSAPGGQRDANGVTLPGTPALIAGSNGQVAWGFTNSYGDWQDWVRVLRDPQNPQRYKVPTGWAAIETHSESIRIKGRPAYSLKVEDTRWGPILAKDVDGVPLALAWIGDLPRAYNLGVMALEHAPSAKAALDLGPSLALPPQNLLAADRAGHIGWTIAGNSIPLRNGFDPQLPADWSQPGVGWTGWAQAAQYPRIDDPADGRLWTANNRTVDGDALQLLGDGGHDLGARAQQIRDDLRARSRFIPADLLDVQLDDRALLLTRWQRLLQDSLAKSSDPAFDQLKLLTAQWSGRADVDSVDYRLVRAFRDAVHAAVLAPFAARVKQRHADFEWPRGSAEAAVWTLLRERPDALLDPQYRDWDALLLAAAHHVVDPLDAQPGGLAARSWGEINRAAVNHPLARALPGFAARFIDMPDEPLPGDSNMPRVAAPGFGASERLDVMPGHEAQSILHMPGGQSDNPLSPYYGAGHEDWVQGRPTPLLPGAAQHTLTIAPGTR